MSDDHLRSPKKDWWLKRKAQCMSTIDISIKESRLQSAHILVLISFYEFRNMKVLSTISSQNGRKYCCEEDVGVSKHVISNCRCLAKVLAILFCQGFRPSASDCTALAWTLDAQTLRSHERN